MTALERDDILATLSPLDFHEKQNDVFANHHLGTGQWLLNTDQFQKWFTGKETSVLWCPGIRTSIFRQLFRLLILVDFTDL
jgi:ankyrin repeat domain-containing protein 50